MVRNKRRYWNDHAHPVGWQAVRREMEAVQTRMFEALNELAQKHVPVVIVNIEPGGEQGTQVYPVVHIGLLHRPKDRNRKIRQMTYGDKLTSCLLEPKMEEFEPAGNMWAAFLILFPDYEVHDMVPAYGVIRYKIRPKAALGKPQPLAGVYQHR